jgi:membrane associated rhomboid family serine protease
VKDRPRFEFRRLGITRGALIVFGLQFGLSLIFMMCEPPAQHRLVEYIVATPSQIFDEYRIWTILTSPLLEPSFFQLLLLGLMMFLFVPTLERFWGTARFFRFVAATSIVGVITGVLVAKAAGVDAPIYGLSPFVWGTVIAYGIVYARQPVQVMGVLPLTGRQMMFGFLAFLTLSVVLQQQWFMGASYVGGMVTAAIMVSKRWSPGVMYKRWKISRAKKKLQVLQGGQSRSGPAKPKRDEQKWLN